MSPDGRRLVFGSVRSGAPEEIWVAEADGSNPQQLTHGPGRAQGSPSWSPDGRRIVFDSFADDSHFHIWMIDADGGPPRRLTTQAGDEHVPTWSRDGRWIYFSSEQGAAARDLWRVSADGKTSERLIRGASGPFACESNDGKTPVIPAKGCRLAPHGDAARRRRSPAAGGVRQADGLWRWSAGRVLRRLRSQLQSATPCARSGDRPRPAPRHARGTHRSPAGFGGVARREDHRVSESNAYGCRPDVD